MQITRTLQKNIDEYLTHDDREFWRFTFDGGLKWMVKVGGRWIPAHIENMEKIYIQMKRENKIERIPDEK